jgi:hypothetical protein
MGDEELNFTEDEARCWENDPCNQRNRRNLAWPAFIILVLFGIALVAIAWAASSGGPESRNPTLSRTSASQPAAGTASSAPMPDSGPQTAIARA